VGTGTGTGTGTGAGGGTGSGGAATGGCGSGSGAGAGSSRGCGKLSCVSVRSRGAGAASGCGFGCRWRRFLRSRVGLNSGKVSVACSGMLASGRCVNTDSGSEGAPGVAGSVMARLALAAGGLAGVLEGRTAW
jgi:hypothetical protein